MKLAEFLTLDELKQAEAVLSGVFLAERSYIKHKVLLYAIDGFYVEVFYQDATNRVEKIRAFTTTNLLAPYLTGIDISALF